jgi:hypothetical protein
MTRRRFAPADTTAPAAPRTRWIPAAILATTAIVFALGWSRFPGPFAEQLGRLMQLEFVALHAGGFLGIPLFMQPQRTVGRVARVLWLLLMAVIYFNAGYAVMRWQGVLELTLMMATTYSGVVWSRGVARRRRVSEVGMRWGLGLLLFAAALAIFDVPSKVETWSEARDVLLAGSVYFLALAVVEASPFYPWVIALNDVEHPRNAR